LVLYLTYQKSECGYYSFDVYVRVVLPPSSVV